MKPHTHHRTIVISDIHLGAAGSKAKEVVKFLKAYSCDTLILNGDIIDGWQLNKSGTWKRKHTRFFQRMLKMIKNYNTKVIYVRGNHDDFLDQVLPFSIGNFSIVRNYRFTGLNGKQYYVTHGDIFDTITTNLKWVAKLGDMGYTFLLWVNKVYNNRRRKRGLPYYSLSKKIKSKVKSAVSYINDYEAQLVKVAKAEKCDGIICGHIHTPAIKKIDDIEYLNSGDWVESLSALVEEDDGQWSLVYYTEAKHDDESAQNEKDGIFKNAGQKQPVREAELAE